MESGTVRLSEVAASGRVDAGFHLARARVAVRAAAFAEAMSAREAVAALEALPAAAHRLVRPIARGPRPGAEGLLAAMREHPFTALALIEEGCAEEIERLRLEVEGMSTGIARLEALAAIGRGRT